MPPAVPRAPEWRAGHLPGAVHRPLPPPPAEAALPDTPRSPDVLPGHRRGHFPRQAATLSESGGVGPADTSGGTRARTGAGLPVAGDSGQGGRTA